MLEVLLRQIDRLYDLELDVRITDFLIGRETCARLVGNLQDGAVVVEQAEHREEIRLGVYVSEETLEELHGLELCEELTVEKLSSLLTAVEEVSHFAYLHWNAIRDKPVTQLELELQAEVDKFVTAVLLLARRNRGRVPTDLLDHLFGGFGLRDGLDEPCRTRYQVASSFARSYCYTLVRRLLRRAQWSELLGELRAFYRLSQQGKLGHISRAVYRY